MVGLCHIYLLDKGIEFCICQLDSLCNNLVLDVVILNIDTFSPSVEDRFVGQSNGFLIIIFEQNALFLGYIYLRLLLMTCTHVFLLVLIWVYCWSSFRSSSLVNKRLSKVASLATSMIAIYLTSTDENVTVAYFFEH